MTDLDFINKLIFKDIYNNVLTNSQKDLLLKLLHNLFKSPECDIVYRGINKKMFNLRIDRHQKKSHLEKYELFFMIGNKAKNYYIENQTTLERKHLNAIDDISDETFKYIFERFYRLNKNLDKISKSSNRTSEAIKDFFNENKVFYNYFTDKSNKVSFIDKIYHLPISKKIFIRDYYLHALHTIGKAGLNNFSFFVSSTYKLQIAKECASENGIILLCWFPVNENYGISLKSIISMNSTINQIGLPYYCSNFYPEQHEFSVKGAIFPHHIFGIIDNECKELIINPHLFYQYTENIQNIVENGLIIDQGNLEQLITNTNYSRATYRFYNGIYKDKKIIQE